MGLLDALFGNRNQIPTVITILPDAAKQEILAGRLPILNTDKLFLKRGKRYISSTKQLIWKRKRLSNIGIMDTAARGCSKERGGVPAREERLNTRNWFSIEVFYTYRINALCFRHRNGDLIRHIVI